MTRFLEFEEHAGRLRRFLRLAHSPESKVLCSLEFFKDAQRTPFQNFEAYIREFVPHLAIEARKSDRSYFLPDDLENLQSLIELLHTHGKDVTVESDISSFKTLYSEIKNYLSGGVNGELNDPVPGKWKSGQSIIKCLFVEDYPDLGLKSRGRILQVRISATSISEKAKEDDVLVHNPVDSAGDRFLAQARDSVKAARKYLEDNFGLSCQKKYRIDFQIMFSGVRFTGDSMGVAFALGVISILSKVEVFRARIDVSGDAAFSGALLPDGTVMPIDMEGLKLKIQRAFFSDLKYLVIPREHIDESWKYLKELESQLPGRRLELVGAERLDPVTDDPRLLPADRYSVAEYYARRAWRLKRSPLVEVPALMILLATFLFLIRPIFDRNPASLRVFSDHIEVLNKSSWTLWQKSSPGCELLVPKPGFGEAFVDLDNDGKNEVLYMPHTKEPCLASGWLYAYSSEGDSLFAADCSVRREYPGDTVDYGQPDYYFIAWVYPVKIAGHIQVVTIICKDYPSRSFIKILSDKGQEFGWYINGGGTGLQLVKDVNSDGREELIFFGYANRMKGCAIYILPADSAYGVSPPYEDEEYDLSWVKRGNQLHYIVIRPTDLEKIFAHLGYQAGGLFIKEDSDGGYLVESMEPINVERTNTAVRYWFDANFRVKSVGLGDEFRTRRRILIERDSLPSIPEDIYRDNLINAVMYWKDGRWVTEGELRAAEKH